MTEAQLRDLRQIARCIESAAARWWAIPSPSAIFIDLERSILEGLPLMPLPGFTLPAQLGDRTLGELAFDHDIEDSEEETED